jgi:hypothetical protein
MMINNGTAQSTLAKDKIKKTEWNRACVENEERETKIHERGWIWDRIEKRKIDQSPKS